MPGPNSWPCSGRPASSRSVSRAPRPGRCDAGVEQLRPTPRARRRPPTCSLDTVLAGVAGARDDPVADRLDAEARHRRSCGRDRREPRPGVGALHREHRSRRGDVAERDRPADAVHAHPNASTRSVGVGRVRHHEEALGCDPPHDDVVDDVRVVGIEQVGVLGAAGRDPGEVVGQQPLQQRVRVGVGDTRSSRGARRRTRPRLRGTPGAPRARRRTGSASPSRRTAPCGRRARGDARRSG